MVNSDDEFEIRTATRVLHCTVQPIHHVGKRGTPVGDLGIPTRVGEQSYEFLVRVQAALARDLAPLLFGI